jgi:hypothetical protein
MAVTTAAVVGVASSAAGTISSFSQASKQADMAAKAQRESERAMAAARKKAEKDFYAGLNVSREAYQFAKDTNLATQNQNIQALQEGDPRNLAAGIGLVQQQADANTEQTRLTMQKDLEKNAKMKADAKDAINQDLKAMDLGYAKDQELRAKESAQNAAKARMEGFQGVADTAMGVANLAPLFGANTTQADKDYLNRMNNSTV